LTPSRRSFGAPRATRLEGGSWGLGAETGDRRNDQPILPCSKSAIWGEYEETYQKQELIVGFTVVFVLGSCLQLCTKDCKTAYMCEQSTENA